jgi:hypothetical protein
MSGGVLMTDETDGKRKSRTRFRALGLLLLLLVVLYMGSYYALESQEVHAVGDGGDASPFQLMPRLVYREKSDFTYTFFKPAHAIDIVLRPSQWGPQQLPIDSMTLYSLNEGEEPTPNPDPERPLPKNQAWRAKPGEMFHDYPVLAKTDIASVIDRNAIYVAVQRGMNEGQWAFGCFEPHHGVRLKLRGKTIDYVICFRCLALHQYVDDHFSERLMSARAKDLLDSHLNKAGIRQLPDGAVSLPNGPE